PLIVGPKMITPSRFQAPPRKAGASASVVAGPPETSIFFSFPPAENPIKRLSGDQKAWTPSSVPGRGWAFSESSERIQSCLLPSLFIAEKITRRPSGEMKSDAPERVVFSGGET